MEKIVDLSKMKEIFLDDKEEITDILKLFLATLPEFLETMDDCIHHEDMECFKFTLHKFKSSCQFIASTAFIETIKATENFPVKEFSEIIPLVEKLKTMSLQLKHEIEDYLEVGDRVKD